MRQYSECVDSNRNCRICAVCHHNVHDYRIINDIIYGHAGATTQFWDDSLLFGEDYSYN